MALLCILCQCQITILEPGERTVCAILKRLLVFCDNFLRIDDALPSSDSLRDPLKILHRLKMVSKDHRRVRWSQLAGETNFNE